VIVLLSPRSSIPDFAPLDVLTGECRLLTISADGRCRAMQMTVLRQVCSDSAIRTSRHSPAELTKREAARAWSNGCPNQYYLRRSGRSCFGSCAHGIHLAKVENTRRHNTPFDSYRYRDGSRSSACLHQSRPGCGMAMQPHSVRRHLLSMIGVTAHRECDRG
jgi:hypothetical protein